MKQTDALGNIINQTTYDSMNLATTVKNAFGDQTTNNYNSLGRLTQTDDPLGNQSKYGYETTGRLQKTQYVYETVASQLSRLLVRTAPNGSQTLYVYGLGLIGHQAASGYSTYHYDYRGSTVALTDGQSVSDRCNADSQKGSIDNTKSLNLYAYASGDPIMLADPLGRSADNWWNSTYESPFMIPSTEEYLTDVGSIVLGGSIDLSKDIIGEQKTHANWYVDEKNYIRYAPGFGEEFPWFPKVTKVLGKASGALTAITGGLDILNTWTENNGNTNGQKVEKTEIQLVGIAAVMGTGVLGGAIIATVANIWTYWMDWNGRPWGNSHFRWCLRYFGSAKRCLRRTTGWK